MKKPTVKDATRQEFIEFFTQTVFGQSGKWQFERWLCDKRYKVLDDKLDTILDLMEEETRLMCECSQKALEQTDKQEKMKWYLKACEHNEKWDKLNKDSEKVQNEINEFIGLGK